jgi:hypothetical protein
MPFKETDFENKKFRRLSAGDVPFMQSRTSEPLKQNFLTQKLLILLTASPNVTHIEIFKDPFLRIRHVKFVKTNCTH